MYNRYRELPGDMCSTFRRIEKRRFLRNPSEEKKLCQENNELHTMENTETAEEVIVGIVEYRHYREGITSKALFS